MFQEVEYSALFLTQANRKVLCFTWWLGFDNKWREEVTEVRVHLNSFLLVSGSIGSFGGRASNRQSSECNAMCLYTLFLHDPWLLSSPLLPTLRAFLARASRFHAMPVWPELRATMLSYNDSHVHLSLTPATLYGLP